MRGKMFRLAACVLAVFLLAGTVQADGFHFGPAPSPDAAASPSSDLTPAPDPVLTPSPAPMASPSPAPDDGPDLPADLFELAEARVLRDEPSCTAEQNGSGLTLFISDRPADSTVSAISSSGERLETTESGAGIRLAEPPALCRIVLKWASGETDYTVQYLLSSEGACEFWRATASSREFTLTRQGDTGTYQASLKRLNVSDTAVYYSADGSLLSSVLLGDQRESGTLPLTIQYDEFGRAVSLTATDLQHVYTYNRAQEYWLDEKDQRVPHEGLPVFDPVLHPAPAARQLTVGEIHISEKNAGIDRAALLAAAPDLTGLTVEEGALSFQSGADSAEVTVDGSEFLSTAHGTVSHTGTGFTASSGSIYAESKASVTLKRGTVTAVYQGQVLESVSDSAQGITWTADGTLTMRDSAVLLTYNKNGNLTEAQVESADGATLIYNRAGTLVGWKMDGYTWSRQEGWFGTAVNENGKVIHPSVSQPAAFHMSSYPAILIQE